MSEMRNTTQPEAAKPGADAIDAPAKSWVFEMNDMTFLVITTIAAAFLVGILALPFTMPSAAHAVSHTVEGGEASGALPAREPVPSKT